MSLHVPVGGLLAYLTFAEDLDLNLRLISLKNTVWMITLKG